MTPEPLRPWDAELRQDLHRRGDRIAVDVEAALAAVEDRTRRGHPRSRRPRMSLGTMIAAAAAVVAIVLLGHALEGPARQTPPTSAPSLVGTWHRTITDVPPGLRQLGLTGRWTMGLGGGVGGVLSLAGPSAGPATDGVGYAVTGPRLRVNAFGNDVCTNLAAGTYTWRVHADVLTLSVVSDPCAARRAVLGGRWTSGDGP
jgi:hypothetical protein